MSDQRGEWEGESEGTVGPQAVGAEEGAESREKTPFWFEWVDNLRMLRKRKKPVFSIPQ